MQAAGAVSRRHGKGRRMNLKDLTYVVAVAEHQNFTRASKAVNVSQPALSSQIRKLESEFGVDIFDRSDKLVRLTPFGAHVVEASRQIGALIERLGATAQTFRAVEATPLRLGMTPTLAAYLSGYFHKLVAARYPGMRVVIVEDKPVALARMVAKSAIDFALIARRTHAALAPDSAEAPFDFTSLWFEPLHLCVREGHPLAARSTITAADVPPDQFIRFDTPFGYELERDLPQPASDAAEKAGIDMRTARFETVCRHIAFSDAYTLVNGVAAEQFRRNDIGLAFVPFADAGNLRELGAITRPDYARRDVLTTVASAIRETPPQGAIAKDPGDARSALARPSPLCAGERPRMNAGA